KQMLPKLADALYASKICSYAQGMALILAGSEQYKWGINLAETAAIWRGGCIIRARLLKEITDAFRSKSDLHNLMMHPDFASALEKAQANWRDVVATAAQAGIPIPALSVSLAYYD